VVSGNRLQGLEQGFVNARNLDLKSEHWQAMTVNSDLTLATYRVSDSATRRDVRHVLDAALRLVEQQSLEGQSLAYLIGRLDEIDAGF